MCEIYGGLKNKQTWLVDAWTLRDEGEAEMVYRQWAREFLNQTDGDKDKAAALLGDLIKSDLEKENPFAERCNVYTSLMEAAMEEVDFKQIGRGFVDQWDGEEWRKIKVGE